MTPELARCQAMLGNTAQAADHAPGRPGDPAAREAPVAGGSMEIVRGILEIGQGLVALLVVIAFIEWLIWGD